MTFGLKTILPTTAVLAALLSAGAGRPGLGVRIDTVVRTGDRANGLVADILAGVFGTCARRGGAGGEHHTIEPPAVLTHIDTESMNPRLQRHGPGRRAPLPLIAIAHVEPLEGAAVDEPSNGIIAAIGTPTTEM